MKPTTVLLTGVTGFVGYYLAKALLAKGYTVKALVRSGSNLAHLEGLSPSLHFQTGDLLDTDSLLEALLDCSTVVHAAAKVSFTTHDVGGLYAVNVAGTENLVNCCLEMGTRRFIHLSSVAALDRAKENTVISERNRWQEKLADTHYARSKFGAERAIWRGQAEGLSVAALYPAIVLGPGNWLGDSTPHLFRTAANRRFYSQGSNGFVDVRDVADALCLVLARDLDGDRFLLSAENLSWHDVLCKMADALDVARPTIGLAAWQTALLWPLASLWARIRSEDPVLTRDFHRSAQANYRYDGSLICRLTGFQYRAIASTIEETAQLYRAEAPKAAWWLT